MGTYKEERFPVVGIKAFGNGIKLCFKDCLGWSCQDRDKAFQRKDIIYKDVKMS